jgi:hypothetical protein
MELRPALESYLRARGVGSVDVGKIARALAVGGVNLGERQKNGIPRNLRITIGNNPRTFRYTDHDRTKVALAVRLDSGY